MSVRTEPSPLSSKTIAVIAIDEHAATHGLSMIRAAVATGRQVAVLVRTGDRHHIDAVSGARVVPVDVEVSGFNPMTAGYAAGQISGLLRALDAGIVQAIGLPSIIAGGSAATMAGIPNRIYALDGLGRYGARRDALGRLSRTALKAVLRGALANSRTRFLFGNADDARALGLDPLDTAVRIVHAGSQAELAETLDALYADLSVA